jgi:anti-anti-sigma factor
MSVEPDAGSFRPPRFDVTASEDPAGGVRLALSGELDIVSEAELAEALDAVRDRPVRVDLSELGFMDSSGLRALLTAARDHPGLTLAGELQPSVQRLLELTQTLKILPFA